MSPPERDKPSPPSPGGEDDIIELTEVVEGASPEAIELTEVVENAPAEATEDAPAEVVLDFSSGDQDQETLKSLVKPPEAQQDPPSTAPREESLDDFLSSLPDLPEDLDTSPEPETPPLQEPATQDLGQALAERLSDEELKELVRQVIEEKVELLVREVFPGMATEAIERELSLWKKRLTESD
jgi:hypothetical protein